MEHAPMLADIWTDLSSDVLALVQQHPRLWFRLMAAGKSQFHAYVIWLRMAARDKDEQVVACHLYDNHPRDLIAEVLPDVDHRFWRLLAKLPPRALEHRHYLRLERLAKTPVVAAMLSADDLRPQHLSFYDGIKDLDPLVIEANQVLDLRIDFAHMLHSGLAILRKYKLLEADEQAAKILRSIKKRKGLQQFLLRRLGKIEVSTPEMPTDSPLKPISNLNNLIREAQAFRNCIRWNASYWSSLVSGRTLFFVWKSEPKAIMEVEVLLPGLITITEIKGVKNEDISEDTYNRVIAEFQRINWSVLPCGYGDILNGVTIDDDLDQLLDEIADAA
jgi:hypothetical protein